jgi:hypothetical protein
MFAFEYTRIVRNNGPPPLPSPRSSICPPSLGPSLWQEEIRHHQVTAPGYIYDLLASYIEFRFQIPTILHATRAKMRVLEIQLSVTPKIALCREGARKYINTFFNLNSPFFKCHELDLRCSPCIQNRRQKRLRLERNAVRRQGHDVGETS